MDRFFGLDTPHHEEGAELLTTTHDDVELSILCSILEEEKIPYLKRDRGSGGSVRIITGYSMFGTDLLVPTSEIDRARELLEAFRNGEPVEDESEGGDEE